MSVRIEIENQMQAGQCTTPVPRKLQDTMPAMLEPYMSQMSWDSFKYRANQDLDIVNNVMQKIQYFRLAMIGIPLVIFIVAFAGIANTVFGGGHPADSSMDDFGGGHPAGSSMDDVDTGGNYMMFLIPFIILIVLIVAVNVCFMQWVGGKGQEALTALRRTCSDVSQEVPGLSMHVQEEVSGFGKHRLVTHHILASVSGGAGADVATFAAPPPPIVPAAQVMGVTPAGTLPGCVANNSAVPNFCPNCGNPTGGANFCGQCGQNLTA